MPEAPRPERDDREPVPLAQRLLDSPFLLLAACIVVMFVFFTGWGLVEIFTLPRAPLP
jgi:hypothetical protein